MPARQLKCLLSHFSLHLTNGELWVHPLECLLRSPGFYFEEAKAWLCQCVCLTKVYMLAYVSQQGVCIQEDASDPQRVLLNVKVRGEKRCVWMFKEKNILFTEKRECFRVRQAVQGSAQRYTVVFLSVRRINHNSHAASDCLLLSLIYYFVWQPSATYGICWPMANPLVWFMAVSILCITGWRK